MAYTDLTASFVYKSLLTATLMQQLATNDAYNLLPSGTVGVFFQAAAPTGWTKSATHDDKALRVVSGAGGGSGGTINFSTGAAHTHTLGSGSLYVGSSGGFAVNGVGAVGGDLRTLGGTAGGDTQGLTSTTDSKNGVFKYIDVICCSHD